MRVTSRLHLSFDRASKVHPNLFILGGWSDHDSGGFLVSELAENLKVCIAEKSSKIARVRSRYSEWWLDLDDRIGYGDLGERDRQQVRDLVRLEDPWSKIILVNPLHPSSGFEL